MTEQEMRDRMKEIDNERNKLKEEREEYEKYFSNKRLKEQLNDHKQYIGKCFTSKNESNNAQNAEYQSTSSYRWRIKRVCFGIYE